MIRILIVDDHQLVREGLAEILASQKDFQIVGLAGNGMEALRLHAQLKPDITLMDLRMPQLDGVAAIQEIRKDSPLSQILVLTTYDSDADIVRAVEAGAVGYLLKDAPRDELFLAVRRGAAGETALSPRIAARLMARMRASRDSTLSSRELGVLELVALGKANQAIALELGISVATVKTHLVHIFDKLGVEDRTSAVTVALERGIISLP